MIFQFDISLLMAGHPLFVSHLLISPALVFLLSSNEKFLDFASPEAPLFAAMKIARKFANVRPLLTAEGRRL